MHGQGEHWETVYSSKSETGVSWYQPRPERSLQLIHTHALQKSTSIIDIGGGASTLTDCLLGEGYTELSVLDIAASALEKAKQRLGDEAVKVQWHIADITEWQVPSVYDLWHDRAVFHFLTGRADQDAYIQALKQGTESGSIVVLATFALDGPEKCSGLPVQRYSPETLADRLGGDFRLLEGLREVHHTPAGGAQNFSYAVFKRV